MSYAEKSECLENLELLGVLDDLPATCGRFSLDVPNSSALPFILHKLFSELDENESKKRFKECWPIFTKPQRLEFRKVSCDWIDEMRITGTLPEFSKTEFDSPHGERFVQFLLLFTTFIIRKICEKRAGTNLAAIAEQVGMTQDHEFPELSDEAEIIKNIHGMLEAEAVATHEFRFKATADIALARHHKLDEEQLTLNDKESLVADIQKLFHYVKRGSAVGNGDLCNLDIQACAEKIIEEAKALLQEYKNVWNQLAPLFEQRRKFDAAFAIASGSRAVFKGIDESTKLGMCGLFQEVCLADGRLDIFKLLDSVRSSVSILQGNINNKANASELALISDRCQKSVSVLALLIQDEKELKDKLDSLLSEMVLSIRSFNEEIAKINKIRRPTVPDWLIPPPTFKWPALPDLKCLNHTAPSTQTHLITNNVTKGGPVYESAAAADISANGDTDSFKMESLNNTLNELSDNGLDKLDDGNQSTAIDSTVDSVSTVFSIDLVLKMAVAENTIKQAAPPRKKFRLSLSPVSNVSFGNVMLNDPAASLGTTNTESPAMETPLRRRYYSKDSKSPFRVFDDDTTQ